MRPNQQLLFPEMGLELARAQEKVRAQLPCTKAHENLISDIAWRIKGSRRGEIVALGCSAFADQRGIAGALKEALGIGQESDAESRSQMVCITVPPLTTSVRDQHRELADRYDEALFPLGLGYLRLHSDPISKPSPIRRRIEGLHDRNVRLVCLVSAENLAPEGARLRDIGCLLGQVLDIAQNAEIPHVLIGDIPGLWRAVTNSPQGSRIHVAMQPLYDRVLSQKGAPTDEPPPQFKAAKMAAHEKFVSILKRYDDFIKPCSKVSLARHYPDIIARVHGDPYRFAAWLYDALGEAGRQGAANLEWEHLRDTAPRTESVNSAGSALSAYCDYLQSTAFEFGAIIKEPESAKDSDAEEKPAKPRKPFEPIPRRDIVPKVA